jgi:phage/plasmid-like protein (TIGR03299 family)
MLKIHSNIDVNNVLGSSGLDWRVAKKPVLVESNNSACDYVASKDFMAVVRSDTQDILGIVSNKYQPIQNEELLWCAEHVSNGVLNLVSAGYTGNGERVYAQLNGNPWGIGPSKDEVYPTFVLSNGHDGNHPISGWPTTVRVICENSLNMSSNLAKKRGHMMISLRHRGNVMGLLEEILNSIEEYHDRAERFKVKANALACSSLSVEQVQQFWTNVYTQMFGNIHTNVETEAQEKANKKAASVMIKWADTFDSEVKHSGANLWTAMNAVTNWLDHSQVYRGEGKDDNRFNDTVFGKGATEKVAVMDMALANI